MGGLESITGLPERLYGPIRERPLASLIFFAVLLAPAVYFWPKISPGFQWLVSIPLVGLLLVLHRLLVARNEPSRLLTPGVLEQIKTSFVGREEDTAALLDVILTSPQVWLYGDSGAGKSLLLQKGVFDALGERGISHVYVNSWRGDWETGPIRAVLEKLSGAGEFSARSWAAAVKDLQGLVLILDQFDEFQIQHRDRFVLERGQVISRSQLEQVNSFFRILNKAVRDGKVRCVFVTRKDVQWGKRSVCLGEYEEWYLQRLNSSVVESEIDRIVSGNAVSNPVNGWHGLRDRLCRDLTEGGVLPVQMRFAVLGLEALKHRLTEPGYLRAGALNGLISRYVEQEVRRVAGDPVLAVNLFALLDRLVTDEGDSTNGISQEELLRPLPDRLRQEATRALEELEKRDITRRIASEQDPLAWRLDHDYLAGPIREITRRMLPEQAELKNRYERFRRASWWQKPLTLASPWAIVRLGWARLRRGLRLAQAREWFAASAAMWCALAAISAWAALAVRERMAGVELGERLFSTFDEGSFSFYGGRYKTEVNEQEARALVELAGANRHTRMACLRLALSSSPNAKRLATHLHHLAVALSQVDPDEILALHWGALAPIITNPLAESRATAMDLFLTWNVPALLSVEDSQELARKLAARMSVEPNVYTLARILGELKEKVDTSTIEEAASHLVARMILEQDASSLNSLARGLGEFKEKVGAAKIEEAASVLMARVVFERNSYLVNPLVDGLVVLKDKLGAAKAKEFGTKLVAADG